MAAALALVLVALAAGAFDSVARAADLGPDAPFLLSMPDLSSPRATLDALHSNGDVAVRLIGNEGIGWTLPPAILRMIATLNVSEVAGAHVQLTAALAAIRLYAVIDLIPADRFSDVPDAAAVARDKITEWRVPGTPIIIAKVVSGPHSGQFLFSSETVALAGSLYDAASRLPQPSDSRVHIIDEWHTAPGPLLPRGIIAALPASLRISLYDQAIWQWIGLAVLLGVALVAMLTLIVWGISYDAHEERVARRYGHLVAAAMMTAICAAVAVLAFYALKIFGDVLGVLVLCMKVLAVGGGAWFVIAAVRLVGDLVVQAGDVVSTSVVRQLIKVLCTLLAIFAAITAGFLIANLFGVPVEPILAGLGIGGLAIALAIRPTLENVIGGLTLFADRPIRVGEFGRFGNESGTVEEIGLRTTKVRRLDDTLATIPNSELAQIRIENVTRRRKFLFNPTLGLRYETTAAQLKQVEAGVLAVLAEHPKVLDDGSRIRFTSFGDYALNLDVFAYVDVTKMPDFLVAQEEINLRIMDVVTRAGTGFAFPSQTNYIAKDTVPGINDSGTNE